MNPKNTTSFDPDPEEEIKNLLNYEKERLHHLENEALAERRTELEPFTPNRLPIITFIFILASVILYSVFGGRNDLSEYPKVAALEKAMSRIDSKRSDTVLLEFIAPEPNKHYEHKEELVIQVSIKGIVDSSKYRLRIYSSIEESYDKLTPVFEVKEIKQNQLLKLYLRSGLYYLVIEDRRTFSPIDIQRIIIEK